jgi:hypothetical protein
MVQSNGADRWAQRSENPMTSEAVASRSEFANPDPGAFRFLLECRLTRVRFERFGCSLSYRLSNENLISLENHYKYDQTHTRGSPGPD